MCQVPIQFRADTKLVESGLHTYKAATHNFNVAEFTLGCIIPPNYGIFNIFS